MRSQFLFNVHTILRYTEVMIFIVIESLYRNKMIQIEILNIERINNEKKRNKSLCLFLINDNSFSERILSRYQNNS